MEPSALIDLVQKIRRDQCESQTIEVKAASLGTPKRLYDTLSSFSNQDEGFKVFLYPGRVVRRSLLIA